MAADTNEPKQVDEVRAEPSVEDCGVTTEPDHLGRMAHLLRSKMLNLQTFSSQSLDFVLERSHGQLASLSPFWRTSRYASSHDFLQTTLK